MNYVNRSTFEKQRAKFTEWLAARGASMLAPTNEWELARWTGGNHTSVVYTNKRGSVTFHGDSESAWNAFRNGMTTYRVAPSAKRGRRATPTMQALRIRDGNDCFFCCHMVADDDASVEHLVPVTHGGPSHMSNYVLAHRRCNATAGHQSAMEKINLHVAALSAKRLTDQLAAVGAT